MYFDARTAKLLPPDAHLIIDGCVGLRLVAGKTKKTWIYRYKDTAGRMKQIRIGQWPAMPVHKAVDAWKVLKDQRHSGADPVAVRKAARVAILEAVKPPEIYTVARLVDDYTTGHLVQHRKQPGAAAAQAMLCKLLADNPEFANQPAASVTRADAFNILEGKKATPTVAKKLRSLLGAAWDYTMDAGLLVGEVPNWWRSVQKGRLKSKGKLVGGKHLGQARRVLHPGEVTRLLAWLPNMHALGRDCVLMYLWTATRGAEFLTMRPEHITIDGKQWWWTAPKELTKNANVPQAVDLRVPLFGRALEVVQRRLASKGKSGLMWENTNGKPYSQHEFSTYIYNLQPYAPKVAARQSVAGLVLPVTHWSPHDLRRTASTTLSGMGCVKEYREAILGHLQPGVEGVYNAYTYDAERVLWLRKLSDHLEVLAGLPPLP